MRPASAHAGSSGGTPHQCANEPEEAGGDVHREMADCNCGARFDVQALDPCYLVVSQRHAVASMVTHSGASNAVRTDDRVTELDLPSLACDDE
jgi:hypothetical protein